MTIPELMSTATTDAPAPLPKPEDYKRFGHSREQWRTHQGEHTDSKRYLPSEKLIFLDGDNGWGQYWSPLRPDGALKPHDELTKMSAGLVPSGEKAWLVSRRKASPTAFGATGRCPTSRGAGG